MRVPVIQYSTKRVHTISVPRKIEVKYIDTSEPSVCIKAGEKLTNRECVELGECSWFRHSQDSFRLNPGLSNLPAGFVEP